MTEKTNANKKVTAAFQEAMLVLRKHKICKLDAVQVAANILACAWEDNRSIEEEVEMSTLFSKVLAKRFGVEHLVGDATNTRTQ